MTTWNASTGDILDAKADALICSANPQLNLSGGVGGALALRFGSEMLQFLHTWLAQSGSKFVNPGEVVVSPACGTPFHAVAHAVAVDAFYDTSCEIVRVAYQRSFALLADVGCRTIAATCLGCGYGRMSRTEFVTAIEPLISRSLRGIDRVEFIATDAELIEVVQNAILGFCQ